ncbi:hypothetical protein E2320_012328, partial [Naja naja]
SSDFTGALPNRGSSNSGQPFLFLQPHLLGRTHPKYLAQESNSKHRGRPPARSWGPFSLPPSLPPGRDTASGTKQDGPVFSPPSSLDRSRASTLPLSWMCVFVWTCMTPM